MRQGLRAWFLVSLCRQVAPLCAAAKPRAPLVGPPHPSTVDTDLLLKAVEVKHTRGSGPGGQHRNKVATAVVMRHLPTGVTGSASESRSQKTNMAAALFRLRVNLALQCRTAELPELAARGPSALWASRTRGGKLSINEAHADFPAVLCEALDTIFELRDVKAAADGLGVSSSQMVKLLAKEPQALQLVNGLRAEQGLLPLRNR